jgi:hypothetical protein
LPKPGPSSADARFWTLWAVAGLFELPAGAMLLGWVMPLPPWLVLALHVLASGILFFAPPREKGWLMRSRHWGLHLALTQLFLPAIGWALAGWLVRSHADAPFAKDAYRFQTEDDGSDGLSANLGTQEAIRRELAEAADVLPAVDALLSRDPALKRGAIEALARLRSPEAIRWIFRARADKDPETRFFATSALTRLKRDFEAAIHSAEKEAVSKPGVQAAQLAVPRIRCEYAASGILDPKTRDAVFEECRLQLRPAAERGLDALRLLYRVERLLDRERALEVLDRLDQADPSAKPRWLRERAETLFELGRHADLKRLLREEASVAEEGVLSEPDWRAAALWWKNG